MKPRLRDVKHLTDEVRVVLEHMDALRDLCEQIVAGDEKILSVFHRAALVIALQRLREAEQKLD